MESCNLMLTCATYSHKPNHSFTFIVDLGHHHHVRFPYHLVDLFPSRFNFLTQGFVLHWPSVPAGLFWNPLAILLVKAPGMASTESSSSTGRGPSIFLGPLHCLGDPGEIQLWPFPWKPLLSKGYPTGVLAPGAKDLLHSVCPTYKNSGGFFQTPQHPLLGVLNNFRSALTKVGFWKHNPAIILDNCRSAPLGFPP